MMPRGDMPTYEYRCPNGHITEFKTSFTSGTLSGHVLCHCGATALLSIPSRPPVVIGETCTRLENQVAKP